MSLLQLINALANTLLTTHVENTCVSMSIEKNIEKKAFDSFGNLTSWGGQWANFWQEIRWAWWDN